MRRCHAAVGEASREVNKLVAAAVLEAALACGMAVKIGKRDFAEGLNELVLHSCPARCTTLSMCHSSK